jgi:KDO2-lipid IV(A) lauroyltransferase
MSAAAVSEQPPPKPLISGVNPISAFFASLLVRFLARMTAERRARFGRAMGRFVFALGIRRAITIDNLRQAFPEATAEHVRHIARGAYESMALGVTEAIANVELPPADVDHMVEVDNWGSLKELLDAGKGVLLATAHFGNWELLGEVMCRRGMRIAVVVKPLKGALNSKIMEARRKAGIHLILARGAINAAVEAVNAGHATCMLVDQVISENRGVFVPFFGRPASTTPAISVAAKKTGAPVFVVMAAREGEKLRMFVEGPIPLPDTGDAEKDIRDHTATVTAIIEKYIRRYPDQWLWLHRRWKVQPKIITAKG